MVSIFKSIDSLRETENFTPDADREAIQAILGTLGKLKVERSPLEATWDKIAGYVLPRYLGSFQQSSTPFSDKSPSFFLDDPTSANSNLRHAGIMEELLVPQRRDWFAIGCPQLEATFKEYKKMFPGKVSDSFDSFSFKVKEWLESLTDSIRGLLNDPSANFTANMHELFLHLSSFGTGCLRVEERKNYRGELEGLSFYCVPLSNLYFSENDQKVIDTVFVTSRMTLADAVKKWGLENLSANKREKFEEGDAKVFTEMFEFVHAVFPNPIPQANFPFKSVIFESEGDKDSGTFHIVEVTNYRTMPYIVTRYMVAPGEIYGRSPSWQIIPSAQALNTMVRETVRASQLATNPVLAVAFEGLTNTDIDFSAGMVIEGGLNSSGQRMIDTLPIGNPRGEREIIELLRDAIKEGYMLDLFQLFSGRDRMTAYEVNERNSEKSFFLSHVIGRQQTELLAPMFKRILDIVFTTKVFCPEASSDIEGLLVMNRLPYSIQYLSPLVRYQNSHRVSGIQQYLSYGVEVATQTQDPSNLDIVNIDEHMRLIAEESLIPHKILRSSDEIEEIRKKRSEEARQRYQMENMGGAAQVMDAVTRQQESLKGGSL